MNYLQIVGAVELGLIFSLVTIAIYLTFKIIDFADLTVDGSFPLGAAVSISLIVEGCDPLISTFLATFAGLLAGFITAYISLKWNIMSLLAGILTMTALYSVNLRIMGRPNIALLDETTIFNNNNLLILIIILLAVLLSIWYLLHTEIGLAIRASGLNKEISQAYGINTDYLKISTVAISNALIAFSGSIFAQMQGFADISMGSGVVIIGLASLMIGEILFSNKGIVGSLIGCIVGAIIYRLAITLALSSNEIGLQASDLNLVTAILVATIMIIPNIKKRVQA